MTSYKSYAYDIAVENADGVTIYYNYINDGKELEVTYGAVSYSYNAKPNSYYGYEEVRNITIPNEVTYMNRTRKVTAIGEHAFDYSPSSNSSIGGHNIIIGDNVEVIRSGAFDNCYLGDIIFGTNIKGIYCGFNKVHGINAIHIKNMAGWCDIEFWEFGNNNPLCYGTLYDDNNTIIRDIVIPEGVTQIHKWAFSINWEINSISLPSTIECIEDYGFYGLNAKSENVVIKVNNLSQFLKIEKDYHALPDNYILNVNDEIIKDVVIPESETTIRRYAFKGCSSINRVVFPNSICSIGTSAFLGCKKLTEIVLGDGLNVIESGAFCDCENLNSIVWGTELVKMDEAFISCKNIESIEIPNSVQSMAWAFSGCSSLSSVSIPRSIKQMNGAFEYCDNLLLINSHISTPFEISTNTFSQNTYMNASLIVPKGKTEDYKSMNGWKEFVWVEEGDYSGPEIYKLTYIVDGEIYNAYEIEEGSAITSEPNHTKDGYTFSGWSEIPEIMPTHDVTIIGTFTKNSLGKCATPTIDYQNGTLSFGCETEGATCKYTITNEDIKSGSGNEVQLDVTYHISVYATKDGYEDSDVVTKEIKLSDNTGDMNGDRKVDAADVVKLVNIIMTQQSN